MFETLFKYSPRAFMEGKFAFLTRIPGEVWILVFLALGCAAWWMYKRVASRVGRRRYRVLVGLRIAILALLVLLLSVPALRTHSTHDKAIFTAILLDTSRSMLIEDVSTALGTKSRMAATREILLGPDGLGKTGILADLSGTATVVTYGFDLAPKRLSDVTQLKARGVYTNIFRSIRDVEAELQAVPLAAVILLTDGCRNHGGRTDEAARLLEVRGVPLYVVGLGNPYPPKDYEIVRAFAPRRVRRNTELEVHVTVRHTGYDKPFSIRIRRGETTLSSVLVEPVKGLDLRRVRLLFTPDHDGTATYRVEVPAAKDERLTENNFREFVIDIRDDRLPVLYIEGSPRKEYRFLRRAIFRDRDFRLVGMLRLANGRFYIQGANAEEMYLRKTFPDTPERLFAFQAVILGDIEAGYFTQQQLVLLEKFVKERGGGLLMLGGVNSFGHGRYAGTPVGNLLPVIISRWDPPYSDESYEMRVARNALKHPVMQIVPDMDINRSYWRQAPPLIGITPVKGVKPGAILLLEHEKTHSPVLVIQNYGQGRVAAFTSGGSWYWQMSKPAADQFHEKFWRQLVRWLSVGAKEQLVVDTGSDVYAPRDAVYIRATVLGKDLKPLNDVRVVATVTDPLGNVEKLPMDWILSQEGVYQCRAVPVDEGEYRVSVRVEGWEEKPVEAGFYVSEPFVEFIDAGLKEEALREMAEITHGRYFRFEEAHELAEAVKEAVAATAQTAVKPKNREIWDMPLLYILVLGMLGIEWFVRRKSGLA